MARVAKHDRYLELTHGRAFSNERAQEIVLAENGIPLTTNQHAGGLVPPAVTAQIRELVRQASEDVTRAFDRYSNETGMFDALMHQLNTVRVVNNWRVRLRGQGFSSLTKEPRVGADGGWVIEVVAGADRVSKALWMQAKQVDEVPSDIWSLPRLRNQYLTMRSHTRASYGLVFSRSGIVVADEESFSSLEDVLVEAVQCRRGDVDSGIVAMTLDRRFVGSIKIDSPSPETMDRPASRPNAP